jgi:hypothetical protein
MHPRTQTGADGENAHLLTREARMRPVPGDLLILKDAKTGAILRDGQILDVRGDDPMPSYIVRWSDSGNVEMYVADESAFVHHFERAGIDEFSLATGFASAPPGGSG